MSGPRVTARLARTLAQKLTETSTLFDYRAVPERDDEGPGYVIERRRRAGGQWHFVGWFEDIRADGKGAHVCYGERLA